MSFSTCRTLLSAIFILCLGLMGCGGSKSTPATVTASPGSPSAPASAGTPTYINGATAADSTGTASSLTIHYAPTAGNTLVIAVALAQGTDARGSITATDDGASGGSQYLEGQPFNGSGGNAVVCLLYTTPGGVKSGVTTVTVTFSQASKAVAVLGEYSGVAAFGMGSDYFDTNGPSATPSQTATIGDSKDVLVMGVNSIGAGAASASKGNLRNSAITSGGAVTSNVGGALVDISAASIRQSVTLGITTPAAQDWLTSVVELKGSSPVARGGSLVQATTAFYQANDSNGAVWAVFPKPTTTGNLIVVSLVYGGTSAPPTIKDYLNTWVQAGNTTAVGSASAQMWYALNSASTGYVISYFAFPQTPQRAEIYEAEYSVPPGTTLDTNAAGSGTSAMLDSGAATTTGANDLLVAFGADSNPADSLTPGAGFTRRIQDSAFPSDLLEDMSVTKAGSYDGLATDSTSSAWGMLLSAFRLGP